MNFLLSKSNILILIIQIVLGLSPINLASLKPSDISEEELQTISSFNQTFLEYKGTQSGSVVQILIRAVQVSNQTSEHKIQVLLNNSSEFSADSIGPTQKYNVYFHYNDYGYIDGAIIRTIQ